MGEPLNRSRVLTAAIALADREGIEALTVRRLADELRVHPTSLYNHLPHKSAILDGVVERLFTEAELPQDELSWQDWVRAVAASFRDLARRHPGAFMVLSRRPAENTAAYRVTEVGLAAFSRGGFSPLEGIRAVRGVSLAVLGLALNECPPMGDWMEPPIGSVDLAEFPHLAIAAQALGDTDDAHWQVVVESLIAGLASHDGLDQVNAGPLTVP